MPEKPKHNLRKRDINNQGRNLLAALKAFSLGSFRQMLKAYTPTAREVRRPMKEAELRELCLRIPCRVRLSRWNPVADYKQYFLQAQRLQHKCPHQINALIEKAMNRHKDRVVTTDEEIQRTRREQWQWRKREHLMRLRLWKHERRTEKLQN